MTTAPAISSGRAPIRGTSLVAAAVPASSVAVNGRNATPVLSGE